MIFFINLTLSYGIVRYRLRYLSVSRTLSCVNLTISVRYLYGICTKSDRTSAVHRPYIGRKSQNPDVRYTHLSARHAAEGNWFVLALF